MVATSRLYTVAEFRAFMAHPENADRLFELINGEIVSKMVTETHGAITVNIVTDLNIYLRQNRIGRVGVEVSHSIDEHNELLPDISLILNRSRPIVEKGAVPQMPDLAIEIRSPTNSLKGLREKVRYYLAHGTRLAWIVLPEQRVIEVYTPTDEWVVGEHETLSGGDILPGFALPVKTIFDI